MPRHTTHEATLEGVTFHYRHYPKIHRNLRGMLERQTPGELEHVEITSAEVNGADLAPFLKDYADWDVIEAGLLAQHAD